ncbi:MAG: hypothetical protein GTN89_12220 [Acidobacteria bacterium]|nr:hypothetical protein [Acidobacteriota bacterium]NIM63246.1 hypothetical protein [Acidobacteriota bacterium]NIO60039.1 hypothetical protein [Acidobacteriota bacterium]NIQ31110.1 hypothetical protein [Acidobacteriota bacterium]NIQ86219.1 hypothetical protein [Acidobacteriota bacterium]
MERSKDSDLVRITLQRNRLTAAALAMGVLVLAGVSGFVALGPVGFAGSLTLPAGVLGLLLLVAGWRVYGAMAERAAAIDDVGTGCARYTTSLLIALAMTEGGAFLGIVAYMLGAGIMALTGVLTHVLLTAILWPGNEKIRPFLGRAEHSFLE